MLLSISPNREKFITICRENATIPVIHTQSLGEYTALSIYERLEEDSPNSFIFNFGMKKSWGNRYSFICVNPTYIFTNKNKRSLIEGEREKKITVPPLSYIQSLLDNETKIKIDYIDHFYGGYVGYFSYDMVRLLENIPNTALDDLDLPDICLYKVDELIVIDHKMALLKVIVCVNDKAEYNSAVYRIQGIIKRLKSSLKMRIGPVSGKKMPLKPLNHDNREYFVEMVKRVKKYIEKGDIYQANISHRIDVSYSYRPADLYRAVNSINPSPFSCLFKNNNVSIVSSSPERLFKVCDGKIETRPIAGTRPRGRSGAEDNYLSSELLLNEKERAEHIMLIDLERNDISKVCEFGSVKVDEFMVLERYSHVWHIVSNVCGRLKSGINFKDIISACFPGGTITGCPKIRCMEIIDELERVNRSVYTGSFGYIGYNMDIDLNILIRTVVLKEEKAYLQVGAGIVWDSQPEKEYAETLHKAGALLEALGYRVNPHIS